MELTTEGMIEEVRKGHGMTDGDIVVVSSREDIPIEDRMEIDHHIEEVFQFRARPQFDEPAINPYLRTYDGKKCKGHERPYKFHK